MRQCDNDFIELVVRPFSLSLAQSYRLLTGELEHTKKDREEKNIVHLFTLIASI